MRFDASRLLRYWHLAFDGSVHFDSSGGPDFCFTVCHQDQEWPKCPVPASRIEKSFALTQIDCPCLQSAGCSNYFWLALQSSSQSYYAEQELDYTECTPWTQSVRLSKPCWIYPITSYNCRTGSLCALSASTLAWAGGMAELEIEM